MRQQNDISLANGFKAHGFAVVTAVIDDAMVAALAVGETAILLTTLCIPIETPSKGTGRVPSNDSLADG